MKKTVFAALCTGLALAIVACHKESSTVTPALQQKSASAYHAAHKDTDADTLNSQFISMNVANTMISSYLASINSAANDSNIKSFTINADSLRAYLSNPAVKNIKLMFAHTQAYINDGNNGVNAGYQAGALTIVIAAYDSVGSYIYYNGSYVLDHLAACPYTCSAGAAGGDLLQ